MLSEIFFMSATELTMRIRRGDFSPLEVVDAFLNRIDLRNTATNAYVTILADRAREHARQAERALRSGEKIGALHGVPIAVKDLFDPLAGVRNTLGSKVFAEFVPQESAVYFERLEGAGAIILGKTNTPEFGHKGVTDNFLFGPTSTPFALTKNAGGSSGGSAAAVADGLATVAQGSDGGGSIRIPASFCGVYGFKPSYGRVASVTRPDGFLSHTPFIHNGPLTRTVEDAALMLSVMCGPHPRDPFSLPDDGTDFLAATRRPVRHLKIAYSPNLDVYPVDRRVLRVTDDAVRLFEAVGATVEPVRLGITRSHEVITDAWLQQAAGLYAASALGLQRIGIDLLKEHRDELTPEFARLIERGLVMGAAEYRLLDVLRTEIFDAVQTVFDTYDVLVTPTVCVTPFENASNGNTLGPREVNGERVDPTIGWCMTPVFNFTGHPAASIPAGFTEDGLPIGMQIIGRRFADNTVLGVSAAFERAKPWQHAYPR